MSSVLQLVSNTWLTPESAVFTKLQYRFAPSSPDLAGPGSQRQTGDSLIAALETRMADLVASSSPNPAVFGSQHQTAAGLTEALESRLIDLADGIRSTRSVMWDINMGPDYMGGVMVGKDVSAFIADHCAGLRQGMIKRMQGWGRLEANGVACAKVHNVEIMRFRYFALRSLTDIANLVWTYQVDPFQLSKKSSSVDFEWSTLCWVIGDLALAFVNILQIIDHVDLDIHSSDKYPIANVLLTAAATRRAFRQAERDIVSIMITLCHHLVNRSKGPTGLTCSATMSSEQRQAMVNRIGAEIEMYMLEMRGQQEIDGKMRFQILRATGISSMDLLTPEQVEGLKDTLHELFDPKSPLSDVVAALSRVRLYGNSALKTSPKLRSYIDGRISHHVPAKSPYTTVTLATDSNFQAAALGKPAVVLVDKKRLLRNLKADLRCEHWRAKTMMLILMRITLAQKQVKKADREPSIPRLVMSPLSMAGTFKACGETSGSSDSEGEDEDDIEYVDDRDEAPLSGRKDEQKEKKKGKLSFKRFIPFVKSK